MAIWPCEQDFMRTQDLFQAKLFSSWQSRKKSYNSFIISFQEESFGYSPGMFRGSFFYVGGSYSVLSGIKNLPIRLFAFNNVAAGVVYFRLTRGQLPDFHNRLLVAAIWFLRRTGRSYNLFYESFHIHGTELMTAIHAVVTDFRVKIYFPKKALWAFYILTFRIKHFSIGPLAYR